MTLTWPFAKYFPFDNIVFGAPSLAFGVLLLAAALFLWRRAAHLRDSQNVGAEPAAAMQPLQFLVVGLGLSLVAITCAGIGFRLFAAPVEEPISGAFAAYPWIEATFMSSLFALVGVAALLTPLVMRQSTERLRPSRLTGALEVVLVLSGLALLLFGALNYFTHLGLIIHTMPRQRARGDGAPRVHPRPSGRAPHHPGDLWSYNSCMFTSLRGSASDPGI